MIEISQLQTLVAVAKIGSFSKAAESLKVTQSAISQSIKNIEGRIGVKIFKRAGKKVVLTLEGEKLFHMGNLFISQMEDVLGEIKQDKETMAGIIRVGTLTGIGKSWLAPMMLQVADEFPELTVSINLGFQEDLVKEFDNYELDFLILPEEALPKTGERELIGEERSVFVYPDKPEYKIDGNLSLEDIASFPTILFQEGGDSLYLKWCKERFGKIPRKINKKYIINSHGNMLQAVQKGLGVAVVPVHVLNRSYYKDKVKCLQDIEVSNGKFFVAYHKESLELNRVRTILHKLSSARNPLEQFLFLN